MKTKMVFYECVDVLHYVLVVLAADLVVHHHTPVGVLLFLPAAVLRTLYWGYRSTKK